MKNYMFITAEGFTCQPDSESIEPDIENLQVIGFDSGNSPKKLRPAQIPEILEFVENDSVLWEGLESSIKFAIDQVTNNQ